MIELIENKAQRKQELLQQLVADVEKFLSQHADKKFYAFAFDCSVYYGEILWAFNTEEDFAETLKYYQENYPNDNYADKNGEDYLSLKYGIGDWTYTHQSDAYYIWGDSDSGYEMYEKADEIDEENGSDNLRGEVMNFYEELLLAFCQTPTYQSIQKTADFKVIFSDHDDNIYDDTLPRSERFMQRLNG